MTERVHTAPMQDAAVTKRRSVVTLVEHGLLAPNQAERIETVLKMIGNTGADVWSITRLKKNPGALIADVLGKHPQVMADSKRKDAEPIVAISVADLVSLVDAAAKAAGPSYATGREMYARLARSGPPLEVTTKGLPRRHQPRLSIDDALGAKPMTTDNVKSA